LIRSDEILSGFPVLKMMMYGISVLSIKLLGLKILGNCILMRNYAAKGYQGVFLREPNEGVVITNFIIHEIGQNFVIRI
jgi:hypothetical protein